MRNKYKAKPTTIDGIRFASQKEGRRYQELKLLEKAGEISKLELQPKYEIWIGGMLVCTYIGDFRYFEDHWCGVNFGVLHKVVEDCKGFRTPVYRLKKKLMLAIHGIEIRET